MSEIKREEYTYKGWNVWLVATMYDSGKVVVSACARAQPNYRTWGEWYGAIGRDRSPQLFLSGKLGSGMKQKIEKAIDKATQQSMEW